MATRKLKKTKSVKKTATLAKKSPPKVRSVTDYLDGLTWDGVSRLDRWLVDYAGAQDTPEVRAASCGLLVAAVRRARQPGCRIDKTVVLEAPQGCGKSAALRVLAGDEWFGDHLPLDDARALIEATAGKWIVEVSELDPVDASRLKALLSSGHDEARPLYQRNRVRVPRSFTIVGTSGSTDYLRDTTGNRRFWPVRTDRFDLDRLRRDRDQLWAEAASREALAQASS